MSIENVFGVLGLIGVGGIIQAVVSYAIAKRRKKYDGSQEFKEKRYKAILLLCYAYLHYDEENITLIIHRPDLKSKEHLSCELKVEWINMSLYASDEVILKMKQFIAGQSENEFTEMILQMRKDLYGVKSKLSPVDFAR